MSGQRSLSSYGMLRTLNWTKIISLLYLSTTIASNHKLEDFTTLQSEKLVPLMQESFPALTNFQIGLHSYGRTTTSPSRFIPGWFCLTSTFPILESVSFPVLPDLLISASHLVYLYRQTDTSRLSARLVPLFASQMGLV